MKYNNVIRGGMSLVKSIAKIGVTCSTHFVESLKIGNLLYLAMKGMKTFGFFNNVTGM